MRGCSEAREPEPEDGGGRWLVVRTKVRRERVALRHLGQRGFTGYCPLFLEPPWHRRAPRGPTPLFPGYVFVRQQLLIELNAIQYCPGVLRIVTFARQLATVDEELIADLRRREADRGYVVPTEVAEGIPTNRKVRVMAGPLKGMEGVFRGYVRGRERARVLMEVLRRRSLVELDTSALAMVRG